MIQKQDRIHPRKPSDLERKYDFRKSFDQVKRSAGEAIDAARLTDQNVKEIDRNMDQREIFKRLTKNGQARAMYMDEMGNIFINASYLAAGILSSMDGTTFYLDLVKGILKGKFSELSISGKTVGEIASDVVKGQTQSDILNKLTQNGTAKGIFFKNGQLYINASYLGAGVLKSRDETTFFLDIENNVLRGKFTELEIAGKKVEWKDNGDGTFTLVGR